MGKNSVFKGTPSKPLKIVYQKSVFFEVPEPFSLASQSSSFLLWPHLLNNPGACALSRAHAHALSLSLSLYIYKMIQNNFMYTITINFIYI